MESIDTDRIIEMAWEDRTPFEAIKKQFGIQEQDVIILMRKELKTSSFHLWRKRVTGRKTKHAKKSRARRRLVAKSIQRIARSSIKHLHLKELAGV